MPAVSVVVPAFGVSQYIRETLESIFAQTFPSFEVLVVNDGSPDTPELEQTLQPYENRIVYLKQVNSGPSSARNLGIRNARGEYIAFLDGDDLWEPSFLASQLELLKSESFDLVYCDTTLTGLSPRAGQRLMQFHPSTGPCTVEALIEHRCAVFTSTVVARRSAITAVGGFDERFRRSEDFHLWARMAIAGSRIGYQTAVLGKRRLHPAGLSADDVKLLEGVVEVYTDLSRLPDLKESVQTLLTHRIEEVKGEIALKKGKRLLLEGDYQSALEQLTTAARFEKGWKLQLSVFVVRLSPRFACRASRLWQTFLQRKTSWLNLKPASRFSPQ